jgi:LysR family transcriptional regulator, transcriptional activator for bauABCD operon
MRVSQTDLRLLRVFDAVVRCGGYSAAGAELNICASTVSNHMTALEQRLGIRLCQRGRAGFSLTEKGRAVHEAAVTFLNAANAFDACMEAFGSELTGELRIGIVDNLTSDPNFRLPVAIKSFKERAPQVVLVLMQDRPQDLQARILDGSYHCGIGSFPHFMPGLEGTTLYQEEHFLYAGVGHPLFAEQDQKIIASRLHEHPTIHRRYWHGDEDQRRLLVGPVGAYVDQIESQLILILSGHYLGFLPNHYAHAWVKGGLIRALMPESLIYKCGLDLVTRKGYVHIDIMDVFISACVHAHEQPTGQFLSATPNSQA